MLALVCSLIACETGEDVSPDTSNNPSNVNNNDDDDDDDNTGQTNDDFATAMLNAVNAWRTSGCTCGSTEMPPVNPLTWNAQLEEAAQVHAKDMNSNEHFSHTGTDGSSAGQRITATGYRWRTWGENIAVGYRDIASVVDGWQKSEGHCKNMMSNNFTEMGAAEEGSYWVQVFARP